MKIIKIKYITLMETRSVRIKGYLCKEDSYYQHLAIAYYFLGIKFFTSVYHSEQIPSSIFIQNSMLGSTDWVSPHKEIINKHIKLTKTGA